MKNGLGGFGGGVNMINIQCMKFSINKIFKNKIKKTK